MLCLYCKKNPPAYNSRNQPLSFCSKLCQNHHTLEKRSKTNLERYGHTNPMKSKKTLEKRNQTNRERYGVENPFSLPEIQKKQQLSCLEKYGVPYASQSEVVQEKIKRSWQKYHHGHPFSDPTVRNKRTDTLIERYGVTHPILHADIHQKIKDTCVKLYGVENAAKNLVVAQKISTTNKMPDVVQKKKLTMLDRYGVESYQQLAIRDQLALLDDPGWLQHQIDDLGQSGVACLLGVSVDTVRRFVRRHDIILPSAGSDFERSVVSFVKNHYDGIIELHDRSRIGKEIDIMLPDLDLAIECNGSYWHSDLNGRTRSYHNEKLIAARSKNIRLINVWEHQWNDRMPIVQSRIKSLLKANHTVPARKTRITELDATTTRDFLNHNHIQGNCGSSHRYGLIDHDNTLLAVMTFGKSRYDKKFDYELLRFCNKIDTTVTGGASKLFKHFVKQHPGANVISYSDRSFNSGYLYKTLGFVYHKASAPSYQYTRDYKNFANRVAYQKHKLSKKLDFYDPSLSEWDNMKAHGYDRIWDCGTDVWHYYHTV